MASRPCFDLEWIAWPDGAGACGALRRAVFVEEQGVPEALEWDGLDPACEHMLARDHRGTPIGTGRLLPDGHVGRMAVLPAWRRRGVGSAILACLVERARERGHAEVVLHAQCHAIAFYARAGFAVTSTEFMEAGLAHVEMRKPLSGP